MAWRYTGRARVDPDRPAAFGVCQRCGIWYNLWKLRSQYQWAGNKLINLGILVCEKCLDRPAPFLRAVTLPPDPAPIFNARPEPFTIDETDYLSTEDGKHIVTEIDDANVVDESNPPPTFDPSQNFPPV